MGAPAAPFIRLENISTFRLTATARFEKVQPASCFAPCFIAVFLSIYVLIVGPPLLVYTVITKDPDPIYWAGVKE